MLNDIQQMDLNTLQNNVIVIRYVAIYIRKSRVEETEADLLKHKVILLDICKKQKWKYEIYWEVANSSTIKDRPEMLRLLKDIEASKYDAVLVIDQDRLSRNDGADKETIKNILLASGTKLCVRDRIMDLDNDTDMQMFNFSAFFASMEYDVIVKRFQRGKRSGAMLGRWTNGPAPFPYEYVAADKQLIVNPEDLKVYRWIVENFISGKLSTNEIAYTLNRQGVQTRKKNYWTNKVILDTLTDETHLGYKIRGKTKIIKDSKGGKKSVRIPKERWEKHMGKHTPVKTEEEHQQIMLQIKNNRPAMSRAKVPSVKKILPLTGLLRCSYCGHNLIMQERSERSGSLIIKKCWFKDEVGNKCPNRSAPLEPVLEEVNKSIIQYVENLEFEVENITKCRSEEIVEALNTKEKKLKAANTKLANVYDYLEKGIYDINEFNTRRDMAKAEVTSFSEEIELLKLELSTLSIEVSEERIDILKSFEDAIQTENLDYAGLNELYKSILKSVTYTRDTEGNVTIKIEYK